MNLNESGKNLSSFRGEEWRSRHRIRLFLQLAITIGGVFLCCLMTLPFLASLAWALALAVLFMPLHRKICRKIRHPTFSAILTSAIAIVIVVIPVILITIRVVLEIGRGSTLIMSKVESGEWQRNLERMPYAGKILLWAENQLDIPSLIDNLTSFLTAQVTSFLRSSFIQVIVIVLTFYLLFFSCATGIRFCEPYDVFLPCAAVKQTGFSRLSVPQYAQPYSVPSLLQRYKVPWPALCSGYLGCLPHCSGEPS